LEKQRQDINIQISKRDTTTIKLNNQGAERYFRESLSKKISGTLVGLWFLVAEHLRLGSWDLIKGYTACGDADIEPRIAMQIVNEAALCKNRIRNLLDYIEQQTPMLGNAGQRNHNLAEHGIVIHGQFPFKERRFDLSFRPPAFLPYIIHPNNIKVKEKFSMPGRGWDDVSEREVEIQYPSSNSTLPDYIPENILVYIATHKNNRGIGIGKKMMHDAIEQTQGDIALHVEPDNPARKLYEKFGFSSKYIEMRYKKNNK